MHFTLSRDAYNKSTLGDFYLESKFPNATVKIQDGKTELKLSMEKKLKDCVLVLSLDQDRLFSASLVFST